MAVTLQIRAGTYANLPASGTNYEVLYTTDTQELYLGNAAGAPKPIIAGKIKTNAIGNSGASKTINFNNAFTQTITISEATSLTLSATDAGVYRLKITNGSAYVITWVTTIKWPAATEPSWTDSGEDWLVLIYDGSSWYGVASLDFGAV